MNKIKLVLTATLCIFFMLEGASVFAQANSHPFLIVKADQFEKHRQKAFYEPWKSMAEDALKITEEGFNEQIMGAYELQDYIGAVALAYILYPEEKSRYAEKVKDLIVNQYSKLKPTEKRNWGGVVPPMSSFFVAILALDIVYDDLTKEEILACEKVIESQIFKINRKGSWTEVRLGTHGVWDIYKGLRTGPDEAYFKGTMAQITPDGVSPITIHYAWERVGGGDSRISKGGYMDVLEFTGIDKRYYSNEKLQKFHRWLFSASVNNSKEMAIIGDMLPTQTLNNDLLHARVGNFDAEAAAYAAWFHENDKKRGHIISYLLPKIKLPYPKLPKSSVYEDGGAFFRENAMNPDGIHAVLYNIKALDEWHTHQEVNGLALSGLGNRLLVNGGRLGAPTRSATLNNTLTINGQDHDARTGNGILESIRRPAFDYAKGDAGTALSGSSHFRNLLLFRGTENAKAYVLLLDEVKVEEGDKVYSYLHPANESQVDTVLANQSYLAAIDHYPTVQGTSLEILYLTKPDVVNQKPVPSAVQSSYPGYPDHNRLEAIYTPDIMGQKHMVTLLNPINEDKDKINWTPFIEDGFEINLIHHDRGAEDLILNAVKSENANEYEDVSFHGAFLVRRKIEENTNFLFAKNAKGFTDKTFEFKADAKVTLWMGQQFVSVIAPEATLLYLKKKPSKKLYLNDKLVDRKATEEGWVQIQLSEGSHRLFYK